jgi:UDP-N-acetylglucosamine--N-acetylmuramyl-(pentapeptide) pyrophosphoryl-undecaprenol N-acetylglucosamine transferase
MEKYFPSNSIILTGNPVRQDLLDKIGNREEAIKHFNLDEKRKTILVVGGSLGARTINQSIIGDIGKIGKSEFQLLWQTGKYYYQDAKEIADVSGFENIKVLDFIKRMDMAYSAADIIISRAGAGTISELCLVGKPVILVPSPNVAEDHQTKNALALVSKNAAVLTKDVDAREKLIDTALELIENGDQVKILSENITGMALRDSAEIIAKEVLKLS